MLKKKNLTPEIIAKAISEVFTNYFKSINNFFNFLSLEHHRKSIWFDIAQHIFGDSADKRTVFSYQNKCCKKFQAYKKKIIILTKSYHNSLTYSNVAEIQHGLEKKSEIVLEESCVPTEIEIIENEENIIDQEVPATFTLARDNIDDLPILILSNLVDAKDSLNEIYVEKEVTPPPNSNREGNNYNSDNSIEKNETNNNNSNKKNGNKKSSNENNCRNDEGKRKILQSKNANDSSFLLYDRALWPIEGPQFVIPREFWMKFWQGHQQSLAYMWTTEFCTEFAKTYHHCVLSIIWHKCREKTRNNIYFNAEAQCQNSTCTKFKCLITEPIFDPYKNYTVIVLQEKAIEFAEKEVHLRNIVGQERTELREKMESRTPKKLCYELLGKKEKDDLKQGNFNNAPYQATLQKINSDYKRRNDLDRNFHVFMEKFKMQFDYGDVIRGYIQYYASAPLIIILFTQKQIEYMVRQKDIFLHIDATGSVAAQPPFAENPMTIYYYTLVLPGSDEFGPLEVMESYSSIHTDAAITFLIQYFVDNVKLINASEKFRKAQCDFSLVMLNSTCYGFNKINLYEYLKLIYEITEMGRKWDDSITIIHACSSHMIKTVRRKLIKIFPDKKEQTNQRYAASNLFC